MINQKVAIITGAGRGIGHGIALQLAQDGCAIAIMDLSDPNQIAQGLQEIENEGQPVFYFQGNLTKNEDRSCFVQEVLAKFGRIDMLINNAGVAPRERLDILSTTEESFDFVMNINLKGTFFLTQTVANEMIRCVESNPELRPIIINIGSLSAYTSSPSRGEYCISKAGITMVTKLFADRLAELGIRVYEIRPGIIQTDMTKGVTEKYDKLIAEGITPIKSWGHPADIANAVSVFCSGKLSFSTGDVINVDGGFHLRRL